MGQWETTIDFAQVIRDGQILLVNTARGTVGRYVSSLMGSTIVSLVEAALREQEQLDREDRHSCLIVADEFQTFTGTAWEELLAEIRKYGGMVLLITQGLARPGHQRTQAQGRRPRQLRRPHLLPDLRRGRRPRRRRDGI